MRLRCEGRGCRTALYHRVSSDKVNPSNNHSHEFNTVPRRHGPPDRIEVQFVW